MFEGRQYKKQAREQLRGYWTTPVLLTLFTQVVLLVIILPQSLYSALSGDDSYSFFQFVVSIIGGVAGAVFEIALVKYYLVFTENREKATFSAFLEALNLWGRGILASLWSGLWTFLWCMLFIVPGIIKAIAYSQILYILAENPQVSVRKAMKISMAMTKGYKGDLFLLELSFIGWMLLALLSAGIGYLWLIPYISATFTNTYRFLKADALRRGVLTNEDFGLPPAQQSVQ
ncbi:DUF975 family protein [Treponema sp. HNW]|uniref:DUF975 family protein n=1 Tax=Treponema sp. HNW TaxID=3116654 RepID=UPI003D0A6C65